MAQLRGSSSLLLVGLVLGFTLAQCVDRGAPPANVSRGADIEVSAPAPQIELAPDRGSTPTILPRRAAATGEDLTDVEAVEPAALAPPNDDEMAPAGTQILASSSDIEQPTLTTAAPEDASVRRLIVRQSVEGYSGSCACPYNVDRAGRTCGRRSAYSRPGGASPICYPEDVTASDVERFMSRRPK